MSTRPTRRLGFAEALPRRIYARGRTRYLDVISALGAAAGVAVGVSGVAVTALYIDMSAREFVILALVSAAWYLVEAGLGAAAVRRLAAPAQRWLSGGGDPVAAWRAAAALPGRIARRWLPVVVAAIAAASWDAVAALTLDLSFREGAALFPGSFGLFASWALLRMVALELAMRPVLEDLADELPADARIEVPRLPLRLRLLAAVPTIGAGIGITVGGITSRLGTGADTLAIASVVAPVVAFGVALLGTLIVADAVTGPIADVEQAARRVAAGDLDARVPVVSADETGDVARSFNEMVGGLRERARLHEAFGAYVDPSLAERVLAEGTDLRGEEVVVSVLFLDVRGFTALAERADAQEIVRRLNDLYDEVVPVILRHGGHANKFVGDGLLAVFGAPRRLADHADRAVAAACEIAGCVRERFGGDMAVGVGVNSGPVLAGTIGGGGRLDFTVIGDTVNTAARVEAATRETGDDVLVTDATVALLHNHDRAFDERPAMPLKGKERAVRLLAPRAA